ncbi:MAG: hypothetical protein AAB488_00080 [Patescibacteria group bacterium]
MAIYGINKHLEKCASVKTDEQSDCLCEESIRARGGYINAFLLAIVAIWIIVEARERYFQFQPQEIVSEWMVLAAFIGMMLNFWQYQELEHGHKQETVRYWRVLGIGLFAFLLEITVGFLSGSLSLLADAWHIMTDVIAVVVSLSVAYSLPEREDKSHVTHATMSAHVISDGLQSLIVVATGSIIYYTGWYRLDIILSALIALVLMYWAINIALKTRYGLYGTH